MLSCKANRLYGFHYIRLSIDVSSGLWRALGFQPLVTTLGERAQNRGSTCEGKLAREWGVPGWFRMRYAYAETTPVLNLAAPSQIRGGWPEVGTTAAESARLPHTHTS